MAEREHDDFFNRLEDETSWDVSGIIDMPAELLFSVDEDCRQLAKVFEDYCSGFALEAVEGQDRFKVLERIAMLVNRKFNTLNGLKINATLQTRGDGLCMTFDDEGLPADLQFISDDTRLRGELLGVHCLPIPTDYALIANISDDENEYVPTLCLMLQGTNLGEYEDDVTSDDIIAIPLRMGSLGVDRVIAPTQ